MWTNISFSTPSMASLSPLSVLLLVLLAHEVICQQETEMDQEELSGLFEFMGSLLEDPTWDQTYPQPCSDTPWPGVECESTGQENPPRFHVTRIHIGPDILNPPCKTTAKLSHSLLKLPYLKALSLFNCFTSSPVSLSPTLFGTTLSSLEHLAIESNPSLTGEIPPSLAVVGTLRVLCLAQNNLQGEIPNTFGGLVSLEELDLSSNNLSGSIPEEIGDLKSLTILDLSWNGLENEVPSSLGQLQFLQKMDFRSNKLQGKVPQSLGQLNRLVLLDLSHNLLIGPIPETLSGLQQLEYLMIEDNPLNSEIPLFLGSLRKIIVLSFSGCGLRGILSNTLSSLQNLSALSLDNNSLNGTVPPNLGALPNLDHLNLSHNQFSGELIFPQEFIIRIGKRLDVKGNTGLCLSQELFKNRNVSTTYPETPPCLGTSASINSSRTWAEDHNPGDGSTLKPFWDDERGSSSHLIGLDQNLCFLCFVVWFIV